MPRKRAGSRCAKTGTQRAGAPCREFRPRNTCYTKIILKITKLRLARLHLKLGWAWILLFSVGGLVLEAFHGLKAGMYLDVGNETRRLMWTLAHAHGTLFGLLHVAFAVTTGYASPSRALALGSKALIAASSLLPAGFFLGGVLVHGGDPGLPILLVPLGAVLLIASATLVLMAVTPVTDEPARTDT